MKIMHIITGLHGGGAEKFVIDLSNELSKNNEVILCSLYDIEESMFFVEALNDSIKLITLNKKSGLDLKIFFNLNKIIAKEKPDVVNTHLRALFYSALPVVFSKTNFFHTVHTLADKETSYFFRKIYNVFFNFFNVVPISISKKVLASVQLEYSNDFNVLIENGVNKLNISNSIGAVKSEISGYKVTKNTKIFLTVGRIGKEKNYAVLVKTVNKLVSEGYDIVLLVIGDDYGELSMLQSIACDRIHFLGVKKNVIDYFSVSDAFCLSSLYEGLPIVLLEALSMGCVSICTPAGGIVDVLDEKTGFLSKGFSEEEYYEAMHSFLMTEDVGIKAIQKNSLKIFDQKYNISKTAYNYYILYTNSLV